MKHRNTRELVDDLAAGERLIVVEDEVDPHLELAEIHRRVFRSGGPALLFNNVRGCRFPVATNLFGSLEQARYIFRDTFDSVQMAVRWKVNPAEALRTPLKLWRAPGIALSMQPRVTSRASVMRQACTLGDLPHVTCWPDDGGPFVTLPQVLSQSPSKDALSAINLGMYRVQLAGGQYTPDTECGLHYQIHRGIGVHHAEAIAAGKPLKVNVSVGGSPAMTVAAVMPLPEGMSELMFAGALGGRRIPLFRAPDTAPIYADADFCVVGHIEPNLTKPEGPFGDHLGYYARVHDFPVMKVKKVYHRPGAIWPMTVVGRPPQEDTTFGELIHELTGPIIPSVLPGVRQVNAVDAAGVHPLLLAVGSERYTPYQKTDRPQELLTQASAILGQGQLSLAKYLWIIDGMQADAPAADHVADFLQFALQRVDWRRDLHFHTSTTMDTLDYSGSGFNQGSKLVIAASGPAVRCLATEVTSGLRLPAEFQNWNMPLPGILTVEAGPHAGVKSQQELERICDALGESSSLAAFPLIVVVDDSSFASARLDNFLWATFTRSNPAADVYGIGAATVDKHFGCTGPLVIDARSKPHHAGGLFEDPQVSARVDARASRGDALARYL